ncbi:MAG TPA: hypothetical protein VGD03_11880 [Frankiaceae bacterium]
METTVALPARLFALRDVEELHDADLDNVLADRLADRYDALVMAAALAQLVGESGPVAMLVHDLGL